MSEYEATAAGFAHVRVGQLWRDADGRVWEVLPGEKGKFAKGRARLAQCRATEDGYVREDPEVEVYRDLVDFLLMERVDDPGLWDGPPPESLEVTPEILGAYEEYARRRDHVGRVREVLQEAGKQESLPSPRPLASPDKEIRGLVAEMRIRSEEVRHLVSHHGPACDQRDRALAQLGRAVAAALDARRSGAVPR